MSTALPSPVHHPTKPAGAAAHEGWETVSAVLPVIDPKEAWMVVFPVENALANPEELTTATVFEEDDQDTAVVEFFVLPSL